MEFADFSKIIFLKVTYTKHNRNKSRNKNEVLAHKQVFLFTFHYINAKNRPAKLLNLFPHTIKTNKTRIVVQFLKRLPSTWSKSPLITSQKHLVKPSGHRSVRCYGHRRVVEPGTRLHVERKVYPELLKNLHPKRVVMTSLYIITLSDSRVWWVVAEWPACVYLRFFAMTYEKYFNGLFMLIFRYDSNSTKSWSHCGV